MAEREAESSPESTTLDARPAAEAAAEQAIEQTNEKYAAILSRSDPESRKEPIVADIHSDAKKLGQVIDTASQVNQLVELAQIKGVAHAVEVARKLNDLYVLDTMHDEMADRLYEAFKSKGLIQGE